MADIVLRDRNGAELQYPGVERVKFNTADGGQVEFVDPALIPEDAEAFIDTDETGFAAGDIEITPEEGAKFSKVTVKKPENLLPENIVAGVDIAGVVGTSGGETVTTVLLEPMTIGPFNKIGSAHPTTNEDLYSFQTDQAPVAIEKGKTYIVDWGETETTQYTVVCKGFSHPELQGRYLYLGDGSAAGFPVERSNEPFCIVQMVSDTGSMVMFVTTYPDVTHTFGLSLVTIQSGGSTAEEVVFSFYNKGDYSTNTKVTKYTTITPKVSVDVPLSSVIKTVQSGYRYSTISGSYYPSPPTVPTDSLSTNAHTITEGADSVTIGFETTNGISSGYSYAWLAVLIAIYSIPDVTLMHGQDGDCIFHCGSSVVDLGKCYAWSGKNEVTVADLKDSAITTFPVIFRGCPALKTVYFPKNTTGIVSNAFYGCSALDNITIPSGVSTLPYGLFFSCSALESVTFEGDITSFAGSVFYLTPNLKTVDLTNCTAVPTLGSSNFATHATDFEIRVPAALYDDFCAASNWSTVASYIVAV